MDTSDAVRIRLAILKFVHILFELRFDFENVVVDPVAVVLRDAVLDDAGDVALVVGGLNPFSVVGKGPVDGEGDGGGGGGADVPEAHGVLGGCGRDW